MLIYSKLHSTSLRIQIKNPELSTDDAFYVITLSKCCQLQTSCMWDDLTRYGKSTVNQRTCARQKRILERATRVCKARELKHFTSKLTNQRVTFTRLSLKPPTVSCVSAHERRRTWWVKLLSLPVKWPSNFSKSTCEQCRVAHPTCTDWIPCFLILVIQS